MLHGQTEAVAGFVATLLDERPFKDCYALGFLDCEGLLVAGVVYHNWQPENGVIEITAASIGHRWGSKDRGPVIRAIMDYPFNFLGCQMVVARISERNPPALRVWRKLGADEHLIPRLYGRDEAAIIFTLTAEQWASSRYANGQEIRTP